MARLRTSLQIGVLCSLISTTSLVAQHVPSIPPQQPAPPPDQQSQQQGSPPSLETSQAALKSPGEIWAEEQADLAYRRTQFIHEYYRHLRKDVDALVALATEFKEYGDNSRDAALPADMIKKIRKMEDLAHDLRKVMYSSNVPHIKKSRIGFAAIRQSAVPGKVDEPALNWQDPGRTCFELADHLKGTMDHYLDQTNMNSISVASPLEAKEIVNIAATLEGLAYELRESSQVSHETQ
jgi:hypothetical protein